MNSLLLDTTASRTKAGTAIVLAMGLAIACAFTFAQAAPHLAPPATPAAQVVRLEPVTVTISSQAFDTIRAEAQRTEAVAQSKSRASQG